MSTTTRDGLYYDPYDPVLQRDPFPAFRRLREEAPLYYNEEHDFYALSRFHDVENGLKNHGTLSSAKGDILELIKMDMELPSGVFIFEDPPCSHRAPGCAVSGVHAEEDERTRAADSGDVPRDARSHRGHRSSRLRR